MFWVRIRLGGREYLGVLDTGATISIVAKKTLPFGSLKNTTTTAGIQMGDGHVVHSCEDCEVEVPMGSRTIAHRLYVMDTEAFDFVSGTDFFVQHSQIQSLTLQAPYPLYVDHGNGRESVPLEQSEHPLSYLGISKEEPSNIMAASKNEDYQLLGDVLDQGLKELGYSREDLSVALFASDKQHVLDLYCSKGKNFSYKFYWPSFGMAYGKPRFSELGKVLTKVALERSRMVLCSPDWGAHGRNEYWQTLLDRLTISSVRLPDEAIYVPLGRKTPIRKTGWGSMQTDCGGRALFDFELSKNENQCVDQDPQQNHRFHDSSKLHYQKVHAVQRFAQVCQTIRFRRLFCLETWVFYQQDLHWHSFSLLVTILHDAPFLLQLLLKMENTDVKTPDYFEVQDTKAEWKTMNLTSLKKKLPSTVRMLSTNSSKVHDLRNPSVPPSLSNEGFQDLNGFTTHIFTMGLRHAFLPPYLEEYNLSEDCRPTLLQSARYITFYNSQNASSIYRTITSTQSKKFFATPTLLNFTKTSPINLTTQVQLLIKMLTMNEHNNEPIEGVIVLPRLDAITKPHGLFTWDLRGIVRDLHTFAKDVKFFYNVHMFRISNNSHDSLSMDPVHMDIDLASIRVSGHAKKSVRNVLLANNIMLPGLTQSRDLLTSMDLVLKDKPQETPHATPTNVVYVRVDIHEDLLPEASPNDLFIFINKLSMKKISDDVSISSQYSLIQREEVFSHDFRVHPQYIRIDIELSQDGVFDFMTSVTKKYPLTSSAPNVLALIMSWSTQHNSFSISTDRSFQKRVSLSELYELFISSPNMKKAVRAITWRTAFSLIVVIELEKLPINPTFVSKAYQVFECLQKQKLQVLHATFLFTPTETEPHLATTSPEKEPNEILSPNRTQTTPSNVTFAFAPLSLLSDMSPKAPPSWAQYLLSKQPPRQKSQPNSHLARGMHGKLLSKTRCLHGLRTMKSLIQSNSSLPTSTPWHFRTHLTLSHLTTRGTQNLCWQKLWAQLKL